MKTETITLKEDVTIEKGTVIPGLDPYDTPVEWERTYKAGTEIEKCDILPCYTKEWSENGLQCKSTPISRPVLSYIWSLALKQGCEISIEEDNIKEYKMFETCGGEKKNYITSFLVGSIEEATERAKKYILSSNLPLNFTYAIHS